LCWLRCCGTQRTATPMRATVILCVACASSFSFLLGYDIGVFSGAKRLIRTDFLLSETEVEFLVGILNIISGFGGLLAGRLADSLGRRPASAIACAITLCGALLMAFAPAYGTLVFGRITTGVGVGCCFQVSPLYIAEVAPKNVRGRLISCFDLCACFQTNTCSILRARVDRSHRHHTIPSRPHLTRVPRWVLSGLSILASSPATSPDGRSRRAQAHPPLLSRVPGAGCSASELSQPHSTCWHCCGFPSRRATWWPSAAIVMPRTSSTASTRATRRLRRWRRLGTSVGATSRSRCARAFVASSCRQREHPAP
jgi:hypothetical protein